MAVTNTGGRSPTWTWGFGLSAWLIWVAAPLAFRGDGGTRELLLAGLPLLVLCGLYLRLRTAGVFDAALALCAFPLTLALSLSGFGHRASLATFSPLVLTLAVTSLLAFLASASQLATTPEAVRPGRVKPLAEARLAAADPRRERFQGWVVAGTSLAMLVILIGGSWSSALDYHGAWGEHATAGATLTAVLAGLVGSGSMAAIVGPGLRAERRATQSKQQRAKRLRWLLAVAVSGAVAYSVAILGAR